MFTKILEDNIVIREVSLAEMNTYLDEHHAKVFRNRVEPTKEIKVDEADLKKIQERRKNENRYRLRLVIFKNDELAGWHYGYSTDGETYYMQNSAVLESMRGQKLYAALLDGVLEKVKQEGFQVVTSVHHPNNPAVLIPKLKKGFVISSTLLHERFRFLVELKYFFNEERRKAYDENMGLVL